LISRQKQHLQFGKRIFTVGSTSREIKEAYDECSRITDGECIESWFEIERQSNVLLAPFKLDQFEVTFSQFDEFVEATSYITSAERKGFSMRELPDTSVRKLEAYSWRFPNGQNRRDFQNTSDHPVVHVSFEDARSYCEYRSQRLPTRSEWEYSAMTPDRKLYASYFKSNFLPVWSQQDIIGSVPAKNNAILDTTTNIYGLTGNVWEWVDTPQPGFKGSRQTKGGSWNETSDIYLRNTALRPQRTSWSFIDVGFRCASDSDRWPGQ